MTQQTISVVGSVNIDLVSTVSALPRAGETVPGGDLRLLLGGKGANQAIAAARAGGRVAMHGAVGTQSFGLDPVAEIAAAGVVVTGVGRLDGATGAALIAVDAAAENQIVVSPGANARAAEAIAPEDVPGDWVLAQLELDPDLILACFRAAKARGARTVLNAAPAIGVPAGLIAATDILIVNETELATYADRPVAEDAKAIQEAVAALPERPAQAVVATLGSKGALTITLDDAIRTPAAPAAPVDTTGAGDCFCGALVARLAAGEVLAEALRFAAVAAAISTERPGAAPSMPDFASISERLNTLA